MTSAQYRELAAWVSMGRPGSYYYFEKDGQRYTTQQEVVEALAKAGKDRKSD
jgi:hypothetical protein